MTLPTCPAHQEFTTSNVLVEFFGCPPDLSSPTDFLNTLASDFQSTYNRLNGAAGVVNTDYCDPFFRQVSSVTAELVEQDDFMFSGMAARKRGLQEEDEAFAIQGNDNARNRNLVEGSFECPGWFEVRFDVTAKCRGCNVNTITLFDEAEEVNHDMFHEDDAFENEPHGPLGGQFRAGWTWPALPKFTISRRIDYFVDTVPAWT